MQRRNQMIRNSKQTWEIGQYVNVGFLKGLLVLAKVATPGDYAPDAYVLTKGENCYKFVPHNGLEKITQEEAEALCIEAANRVRQLAEQAMQKAVSVSAAAAFQSRMLSMAI
jgi:hypothetical protein